MTEINRKRALEIRASLSSYYRLRDDLTQEGLLSHLDFLEDCVDQGELQELLEAIRFLPKVPKVVVDADDDLLEWSLEAEGDEADQVYRSLFYILSRRSEYVSARMVALLVRHPFHRATLLIEIMSATQNQQDVPQIREVAQEWEEGLQIDIFLQLYTVTGETSDLERARTLTSKIEDLLKRMVFQFRAAECTADAQDVRHAFETIESALRLSLGRDMITTLALQLVKRLADKVVIAALPALHDLELRREILRQRIRVIR